VAQLSTGERGSVSGKEFFAAMMDYFGAKVRTIEGNWRSIVGIATNLDQFNRAILAGLDDEAAAALTWTGLRASDYGYDKVTIVEEDPPGARGYYTTVRVEFSR
jgi:hypothetical protein